MPQPTYLVQNRLGTYYFRYVIPKALRGYFPNNKREFRRSLGTRSRTEAIRLARVWWVELHKEFSELMEKEGKGFAEGVLDIL